MNRFVAVLFLTFFTSNSIASLLPRGLTELSSTVGGEGSAPTTAFSSVEVPADVVSSLSNPLNYEADLVTRSSGTGVFARNVGGVVKVVTRKGEGSGALVSEQGLILTNWHVVGAERTVGVVFVPTTRGVDPPKIYQADVLKVDAVKDLALIKVRVLPTNAVVLKGASQLPAVGGDVHAIGHPFGQDWSYTRGYVSAVRDDFSWEYSEGSQHIAQVIQTQTPINPGNSGGPLFDDSGMLIGINSFGNSQAQGVNYAVSINSVREFIASAGSRSPVMRSKKSDFTVLRAIDVDEDGRNDGALFDVDGDGEPDGFFHDEDGDGGADVFYLDTDGNGKINVWLRQSPDGRNMFWYFDDNEDGTADTVGIDEDKDGEVDYTSPA